MEFTLESIGLNKEVLQSKVIEAACKKLLVDTEWEDEDCSSYPIDSEFKKKIENKIKIQFDDTITAIAEKHVYPKINELIEQCVIQRTNEYGEKKGQPTTLVEFLCEVAKEKLMEPIDSYGRTEQECRLQDRSWYRNDAKPRIVKMIGEYLHKAIQEAISDNFKLLGSTVAQAVEKVARDQLKDLSEKFKLVMSVK